MFSRLPLSSFLGSLARHLDLSHHSDRLPRPLRILHTVFAFHDHRRRRGSPYLPGPPSWPIIGNLLDVPNLSPWLVYANMSKKYGKPVTPPGVASLNLNLRSSGGVVCLQVFGQVVIVLSSLTAIKDLVERRGELYADRTPCPIFEMFVSCFLSFSRCRC